MKKTDITNGLSYLEVPEVDLRILCGCPENSIKFIMQKGLTPAVTVNGFNLVGGPNCILLNDYSVQNSHFLNFAEFPVLHQQFFQGAAFNGTSEKFTLIGNEEKVDNQYNYIRRGLCGLISKDEIITAGVENHIADKFIALGNYHRGIEKNFNIINKVFLSGKTNIKGDLYIERISINIFKFTYKEESVTIDINLDSNSKGIGLPYKIDYKLIPFQDFSVTTVGDGNGWNPEEPCLSSVITSKGKRFLVDSGPGSFDLIRYLGISPSEIEGVFVTHSHDDHFAGILSMLNSDSKIKFISSHIVIASVEKKFEALLNISREELKKYIDFIPLRVDVWTDIGELEVKPNYSFHTIETNVFYFRSKNSDNEWKVYGHITDIISRKDLDFMLDNDQSGKIQREWADRWFNHYLEPCDLKRIDAGGGVVHGNSHDFIDDKSTKIILSHLNHEISTSESPNFHEPTEFGHIEVLIDSDVNYLLKNAKELLNELNMNIDIDSSNIVLVNPKEIIFTRGEKISQVYLVLSGVIESNNDDEYVRKYVKGDFIYSFGNEKKNNFDYVANCYSYLFSIDYDIFTKYIKSLKLNQSFKLLRDSSCFSYGLSFNKLLNISKVMEYIKIKKGNQIIFDDYQYFIVGSGRVDLINGNQFVRSFNEGDISVYPITELNKFKVVENTAVVLFRHADIYSLTSLSWSIFEELKKIETIVETAII